MTEPILVNAEEAAAAMNALAEGDALLPGGFELGYEGRLSLILRAINRFRSHPADTVGTIRRSPQGCVAVLTTGEFCAWAVVEPDGTPDNAPFKVVADWPVIYRPEGP